MCDICLRIDMDRGQKGTDIKVSWFIYKDQKRKESRI